jgi:hypothetical protein
MTNRTTKALTLTAVAVLTLSMATRAQDQSAAALAKKAQNPIANMISVPLQNNTNFGIGLFDRTQNVLNIQPVLPSSVGKWSLINRVIAPVIKAQLVSVRAVGPGRIDCMSQAITPLILVIGSASTAGIG